MDFLVFEKEFKDYLSSYIKGLIIKKLTHPLLNMFGEINNFFAANPEANNIEGYFHILDNYNLKRKKKEIHLNNKDFAYEIIRIYNEILLDTQKIHNEFNSKEYLIDEASLLQEESIIANETLRISRKALLELSELIDMQEKLMIKKEQYLIGSNKTWENQLIDVAKNFGGGALAATNPLVGIPMLVNNYLGSKKSEELIDTQYNNLIQDISEYVDQLLNLDDLFAELSEEYYKYLEGKIINPIVKNMVSIFKSLQESGVRLNSIEFYFEENDVAEEKLYD